MRSPVSNSAADAPLTTALKTMETLPPHYQRRYELLAAFRRDVWGNPSIFTQKSQSPRQPGRTVEFLNLEPESHHEAAEIFCTALRRKEILVTQEYRNAMDRFKSNDLTYEHGACILGQPGIGKSVFIVYAVIERLREKRPVAVQVTWGDQPGAYVLFSERGVGIHSHSDPSLNAYVPDLWAFSDSTVLAPIPTPAFLTSRPALRIFQTASPNPNRWKQWTKERDVDLYIMDLWSFEEIEDLVFISKYDDHAAERIKPLFDKWGPVPRTLIKCLVNDASQNLYESNVAQAVANPDTAIKAVSNLDNTIHPGSSTVYFVKPRKEENFIYRNIHTVFVPTRWLVDRIVAELGRLQAAKQLEYFRALSAHPNSRSMAGWVFEEIVHVFLVRASSISVNWCDEDKTSVLKLPSSGVLSTLADLNSPTPFYWRPNNPNNPGVDSAIVTNDHIYVIQTTISRKHTTPQDGVNNLWRSMPQNKKALKWSLLFVGSAENQTKAVTAPYARGLTLDGSRTRGKQHVRVGWFSIFSNGGLSLSDTESGMEQA